MSKTLPTVVWRCVTVFGQGYFAGRGNSQCMWELNTKIMTWIFRFLGSLLVLLSILTLFDIRNSK